MLKKVAKALDEMAKNEELMAEILAAAEDDIAAAEGQVEMDDKDRLNTIGEDDERHLETKQEHSKGQQQIIDDREDEEAAAYADDQYEEENKDEEDYEF